MALFRKWLDGETRRGSILAAVCDRGATKPGGHFLNNPSGGGSFDARLCRSSVEDRCGYSPSSLRVLRQNPTPRHTQLFKTLCILDRALSVASFPERGRIVPEIGDPAVREIIHGPYRIIYEVTPGVAGSVYILRFWHGARGNPEITSVP